MPNDEGGPGERAGEHRRDREQARRSAREARTPPLSGEAVAPHGRGQVGPVADVVREDEARRHDTQEFTGVRQVPAPPVGLDQNSRVNWAVLRAAA
jgi:hypothetical protein